MSFHDVDSDGEDSERSSSGWLGGIADVAHCLTENVKPVVSGVASFVHQAAVAVASEIAQLEQEGEFDHSSAENLNMQQSSPDQSADQEVPKKLILPWEISTEEEDIPGYVTDNDLKDAILTLSDQESTFVEPFQDQSDNPDAKSHHPSHIKPAEVIATVDSSADIGGKKVSAIDNKLEQDDESLVPASEADDSSYVLPSAPTTGNTLTTTQSVDDLVLVNSQV
ncbi:MAG: hypothetical protein SGILL_005186 [Bacillariaceae sp.]